MSTNNPKIIVTLGMHRSGTSALTRALQVLGVELGDNLMPPAANNNETGFFEDIDVNRLNIDILKGLGYGWQSLASPSREEQLSGKMAAFRERARDILRSKLADKEVFGLKDPRICRLLPFWQGVFDDLGLTPRYLIACRNPLSVAQSLIKRDRLEPEKAHLLWQEHMLKSLQETAGKRKLVVDYDQLLAHPATQLERIARHCDLDFDSDGAPFRHFSEDFLDPALRHDQSLPDALENCEQTSSLGRELFQLLQRLALDELQPEQHEVTEQLSRLDSQQKALSNALALLDREEDKALQARATTSTVEKQLRDTQQLLREQEKQAREQKAQLNQLLRLQQEQVRQLEARNRVLVDEVLQYKQSTSWRITAPLRRLVELKLRAVRLKDRALRMIGNVGGMRLLLSKVLGVYRSEGLSGLRQRIRLYRLNQSPVSASWPGKAFAMSNSALVPERISLSPASARPASTEAATQPNLVPSLRLALAVHLFYPELWPDLARRIRNMPFAFDLFVTVPVDRHAALLEQMERHPVPVSARIVEVANLGYDLLPFIKLLPQLIDGEYDLVCKLHSKKGSANLEQQHPELGNLWLDLLIDPLLGSEATIRDIVEAFARQPQLGMLGSADLYKAADRLMYGNEVQVARLLQEMNPCLDPARSWGFFAGSMFWARLDTLKPLLSLEPTLLALDGQTNQQTGAVASPWHALERCIGLLPELAGQQIALSYSRDLARQEQVIELAETPVSASRYGIGLTLVGESRIASSLQVLQEHPGFDSRYYSLHTPQASKLGIEPALHFLRYGIQTRQSPNERFCPEAYWEANPDVLSGRHNAFIHYLLHGRHEGRSSFPPRDNQILIAELIGKSGWFDSKYYLANNPDVRAAGKQALQHFCETGHLELRKPSAGFDTQWYLNEYLVGSQSGINPLLHFIVHGQRHGLRPRPSSKALNIAGKGLVYPSGRQPRRACLFASYDAEGRIDDYVVDYLRALSQHADVFFLCDAQLQADQLQKLSGLVQGAWAVRHGEYDFGSYSRLARFFVGWSRLKEYDEIILANDSCYLIDSLDNLFAEMDKRRCDWWGLQATKGISATRQVKSNGFKQPIALNEVKRKRLGDYERDDVYDFLIGSYFLVFRQPVVQEGSLVRMLDGVKKQPNKKAIILSYEIGLTRMLIQRRFEFDTFIRALHPFHPIYTERHFDLIAEGMPLFKRFFLTENHYHVPELWRWKERLLALKPGLDLRPLEHNLQRVVPADKLYRSLHIPRSIAAQDALLDGASFLEADGKTQKHENWWAFPVCAYDHSLSGNDRAVFEEVRLDPSIKKVILTRSKEVRLTGDNVEVVPLQSRQGQELLMRCKYIFIKHTPRENALYPLRPDLHRFINLWHGIPLKRIGYTSLDLVNKLAGVADQHSRCHSVISSSKIDRLAMASAFYPLTFHHVWTTGLPRNDFILRDQNRLPEDLRSDLERLEDQLQGKRLVLFAPTFRNSQADGHYAFSAQEKRQLADCLQRHGALLGIREHMADQARGYSRTLADLPVINLSNQHYANIEMLYRKAELLITDYSSCFIDFMLTGKKQICFAFDHASYAGSERGLFYDLDMVFPGPICESFADLMKSLEQALSQEQDMLDPHYALKRRMFFDYLDDNNSARVVRHIKAEFVEQAPA
ncbi:MAG: CDP-glycerol glycerophosphotransferase family protein [Pseudomonadaceae bacterium]|nr:CDP-glycerol glycerophosphotransferase family protein [Pseudomonadaceae bacterium]